MVRVRVEWCMERDDIALLQQLIERHVLGGGLGATVMGQYAAAEAPQPVNNGCADASCSDDPDRHIAEFSATDVVQSVVVGLRTGEGGLGMSHRHQHQHQRVVSDAVGRIGDILDGDAHALRIVRRRYGCTPRFSWRCISRRFGEAPRRMELVMRVLMSDADASIPRCEVKIGRRDTAASVTVGTTPKRGAISRNRTASSCPQP